MAQSKAQIGYGTLLQRGDPASGADLGAYTTIAEATDITPPQSEADDVEVTHMESPGRRKEFIQGLIDSGEASCELNWVPDDASQDHVTGVMADQNSGIVRYWRLRVPLKSGGTLVWGFTGYVKSFNPSIPVGDKMTAQLTLKVSGANTFA